jgi:membrane carboxypeptidase/penicillin-binding protein
MLRRWVLDRIGVPALPDIAGRLGVSTLGKASSRYGLALRSAAAVTPRQTHAACAAFNNGGG